MSSRPPHSISSPSKSTGIRKRGRSTATRINSTSWDDAVTRISNPTGIPPSSSPRIFFSHLGVFRSELIKEVGFRAGFEGSQDYDLVLRCIEKVTPEQIRHIPRILYHWRMSEKSAALNFNAKPHARAAAIKALEEHLARRQIAAEVTNSGDEDFRRIRYALPNDKPRVSIIIATRDLVELLQPCVESFLDRTTYPNFELFLIDNHSQDRAALAFLETIGSAIRAFGFCAGRRSSISAGSIILRSAR